MILNSITVMFVTIGNKSTIFFSLLIKKEHNTDLIFKSKTNFMTKSIANVIFVSEFVSLKLVTV